MTGVERKICCWRASTWCKVVAWINIVRNALWLVGAIKDLVTATTDEYSDGDVEVTKGLLFYATISIVLVASLLGFIMGVVLYIGARQKRVNYLQAWWVYGFGSLGLSVLSIILEIAGNGGDGTVGAGLELAATAARGSFGVGFTLFTFVIVTIYKKELGEGILAESNVYVVPSAA